MICPKCGATLNDSSRFCNVCGEPLSAFPVIGSQAKQKKHSKPHISWLTVFLSCLISTIVSLCCVFGAVMLFANKFVSVNSSSLSSASDSSSSSAAAGLSGPASDADDIIDFNGDGWSAKYVKHEVGTDYNGNSCLLFYYTFTNTGSENASAYVDTSTAVFQNGVECEHTTLNSGNSSAENFMKDIQPGGSIEVCEAFSITDLSDVTVEVSNFISVDNIKDTQILKLQ